MPKLITTRTRAADVGKPRIIVIGGGFGDTEVIKKSRGSKTKVVLFDKRNQHTFQPLPSRKRSNTLIIGYNEENPGVEEAKIEIDALRK